MTPPIFPRSLPSTYDSLKIIGTIITILYIVIMDVIVIYPRLISCYRDGEAHCSWLTLWYFKPRDKRAWEQFVWEACREMLGHCVYVTPCYMRFISSVDKYMIYVDRGKFIASRALNLWPKVVHVIHSLEPFTIFKGLRLWHWINHIIHCFEWFIASRVLSSQDLELFISSTTLNCS